MMSRWGKKVILGLMAKSECPWRPGNGSARVKLMSGTKENKGSELKKGLTYKWKKSLRKQLLGSDLEHGMGECRVEIW